jgi:hypothetical protein
MSDRHLGAINPPASKTVNSGDREIQYLRSLREGDEIMHHPPGRSDWPAPRLCRVSTVEEYRDGGRRIVISPKLDRGISGSIIELPPE